MNKEREHISRVREEKHFFPTLPLRSCTEAQVNTVTPPHEVLQDGDASPDFF